MQLSELQNLYHDMLLIRRVEEALQKLFADGQVPGFLHLSIGQEAVPVGISACLRNTDTVSSNHRGHGHALAKGVALDGFFAEVTGKVTGICRGRGGSMHVADFSIGMLGANGIVAAGLPITTGSALALKMRGKGDVAVVYFGDGAVAEGIFHECMNIAALWNLPVLFACENNGWSEFSPTVRQLATSLEKLSTAFGIPYRSVDGNDVVEVADNARALLQTMRETSGPAVLECQTTRIRGHFEGDRQDYRDAEEIEGLAVRDPIRKCRTVLVEAGVADDWFDTKGDEIAALVAEAVEQALAAPEPSVEEIDRDVYTPAGAAR